MTKSNGGQTDAFVGENIAHGYDVVMTFIILHLISLCLEKSSED